MLPADENVGDGGPFDRTVPAEGEARLVVDILRVSCVRTIVTLVDGNLDLRSFRMRLPKVMEMLRRDDKNEEGEEEIEGRRRSKGRGRSNRRRGEDAQDEEEEE